MVQLGEVDAGIVYRTDVQAAGAKVKGIEIPAEQNASTSYPIAALAEAPNAGGGEGVRRLRAVRRGHQGADRGRLRESVTAVRREPDQLRSASRPGRRGAPWPLAVPAAVAVAFLLLPLAGLLVRAPWRSLPTLLARPAGPRGAAAVAGQRQPGHR